jgi:hypothetical protein
MDEDVKVAEAHLFARPLSRCPSCGSVRLVAVRDDDLVNFSCDDCARCWHVELAAVWRVDPKTCARCRNYERCAAAYAADHQ